MGSVLRLQAGDAWPAARVRIERDDQGVPIPPGVGVTLRVWRDDGTGDVLEFDATVEDPNAVEGDELAGMVVYQWSTDEPVAAADVTDEIVFRLQFQVDIPGQGTFTSPTITPDYLVVYPRRE